MVASRFTPSFSLWRVHPAGGGKVPRTGCPRPKAACCLLLLCFAGLSSCAKESEPQPPLVLVPRAATDLRARQYDERILLTVSMPAQNTNGSQVTTLGQVEIFRLASDRGNAGPLPEAEFLAQAERILAVPVKELGRYLIDGALTFGDPTPADPATFYAQGIRYAVRFINRKNQTAGLSNQVFVAPVSIPAAPEGLSSAVLRDSIRLTWKPPVRNADGSVPARVAGYNLYRSEEPKAFPAAPLNVAPLPNPEFEDRDFEFDTPYYYKVAVVGSRENPYAESLPSAVLQVIPRDVFPPGLPTNLSYVVENGVVTLLWEPPDDADLAGYEIYRQEEGTSERILLQVQLVTTLSFRDDQVRPGKKYAYSVVAVDTHKNESRAATTTVEVR